MTVGFHSRCRRADAGPPRARSRRIREVPASDRIKCNAVGMGDIQLGTVGDFVGGAAAAVALGISGYTILRDRRRARRALADRVHAWSERTAESAHVVVWCSNSGDGPIFDITFRADLAKGQSATNREPVVALVPGPPTKHLLPIEGSERGPWDLAPLIQVDFNDAGGFRWRRELGGSLTQQ